MNGFWNWWATLSDAQATILASIVTVLGAAGGVLLGWRLFSGRITNFEQAMEAVERRLDQTLTGLSDRLQALEQEASANTASLGSLRADAEEQQASANLPEEQPNAANLRELIKTDWIVIRDRLETIAANPAIDGRRRAKYARFSRRNYADLIESLAEDGQLGRFAQAFREANALWQQFQRGRAVPTDDARAEMSRLREATEVAEQELSDADVIIAPVEAG